jgi:nitric oxide reductase subunit B
MRTNTFDASRDEIVISDRRAQALAQVAAHYDSLFSNDPTTAALRESYAMRNDTVPDAEHRRALSAFFFWTSWATVTDRPGEAKSYSNNWPYEPLVGNAPTSGSFMWTMFSVLFMIAGIGVLAGTTRSGMARKSPSRRRPATRSRAL